MIKQVEKSKTVLAILTFWLLCQNSYALQTKFKGIFPQESDYVNSCSELVIDTLTTDEKKRIDVVKNNEEMQQKKESIESELVTAKDMKKYEQEERSRVIYQEKKMAQERKRKPSTNNGKAVVFGIRAGVNLASLEPNSAANGECSMITSYHAGLNLDIRLIDQLHINTSLLFSQKGYKYEHNWDRERQETTEAQFIMLPVQLSGRIGFFQINVGPYVEYGIGGEIEYGLRDRRYDTFSYYEALNYGITAGVGFNLGKHFYLGANYEMGLSDYANRNVAVSLGINF